MDKDGHVSTSSIIHTTEVNSYSKLIFIAISINGWTKESYGLSIDIFLATLLNLWYFQNKKCFPWTLFVPCGLLWLAAENKTQFILSYLQYTRRFDLNIICCWLNLSLSLLQSHFTAGLIRWDEVKMLVIYGSSHTGYHRYDNKLNFPNKLWYDLLLIKAIVITSSREARWLHG